MEASTNSSGVKIHVGLLFCDHILNGKRSIHEKQRDMLGIGDCYYCFFGDIHVVAGLRR